MSVFDNREFNAHELVVFGNDEPTALRAIVAVHSTALGPPPAAAACGPTPPPMTPSPMRCASRAA